ncbi:hypothetical protein FRC11_000134, partial [Ceratobasidium sp. 423]
WPVGFLRAWRSAICALPKLPEHGERTYGAPELIRAFAVFVESSTTQRAVGDEHVLRTCPDIVFLPHTQTPMSSSSLAHIRTLFVFTFAPASVIMFVRSFEFKFKFEFEFEFVSVFVFEFKFVFEFEFVPIFNGHIP